jgi:uncharacterized RDD family membrane protein YckC
MIFHEIVSTEKVPFRFRVAGLGSRFLAWLVDGAALLALFFAGALVSSVLAIGREGVGMAVMALWVFVLMWGYFLLFEWLWHGQTLGKRLLGIRVIQWDGTEINFVQAAVRSILRFADALPLPLPVLCGFVGFAAAACNRENRRLGDLAAGTLVVHVERGQKPIRALQDARAAADRARLTLWRQRLAQLDREQKQTLLDLCLRRDQLRVGERARLFQAAAGFFQSRLDLAPEAYESPEKFVLQLAAVLGERPGEGGGPLASGGRQATEEGERRRSGR